MEYIKNFAKKLRKEQTQPELIIWNILRQRRFFNLKFRRQVPFGEYIADFACYEKKIIIELDGSQHLEEKNLLKDRIRTEYLNDIGFTVFRFYNSDILNNLESVLTFLYNELVDSPSSELRSPSPIKGEGIKHQP